MVSRTPAASTPEASGGAGAFWNVAGPEAMAAFSARANPRSYARGEALMHAGQVPREVFLLRAGRVKVSASTSAGRHFLLAVRGPGDLVGELSALDDLPRSATIEALEAVDALVLQHADFRAVLAEHPDAAMALLRMLSARLRDADAKRIQLAGYTALGRVAFCLLELCDRFGEHREGVVDILLPLSQEELAGWAGASLESVARALGQMRELGWIETRRRGIRVLDRAALTRATA
jgi:CRP/FNR family transcriptional regulator, cyclic AMP receptor protein